jgi:hypothetical protein
MPFLSFDMKSTFYGTINWPWYRAIMFWVTNMRNRRKAAVSDVKSQNQDVQSHDSNCSPLSAEYSKCSTNKEFILFFVSNLVSTASDHSCANSLCSHKWNKIYVYVFVINKIWLSPVALPCALSSPYAD